MNITGTHCFTSHVAARQYYGLADAKTKLAEGAIAIGKPENLPAGATLQINSEGRYMVCQPEKTKAQKLRKRA